MIGTGALDCPVGSVLVSAARRMTSIYAMMTYKSRTTG